jgi:hypothetical protein
VTKLNNLATLEKIRKGNRVKSQSKEKFWSEIKVVSIVIALLLVGIILLKIKANREGKHLVQDAYPENYIRQ